MPVFLFDNFNGTGFLDQHTPDMGGAWITPDVDFDDADFAHHPGDLGLDTIPLTGSGGIYNTYGGAQAMLLMPVSPPNRPDYAIELTFTCDPTSVLGDIYIALRAKPLAGSPWLNAYSMAGVKVSIDGSGGIHVHTYDTFADGAYTSSGEVFSTVFASGRQRFTIRAEVEGATRTIKFNGVVVWTDELTDSGFTGIGTVAIAVVTSDPSLLLSNVGGDNNVKNDIFWTHRVKTTEV